MAGKAAKKLIKNGKRSDGRGPRDIREVTIEAGVLHRADGSAYLEWGANKVLAAVYGPREALPRHSQDPNKAVVKCRYNMAAFSVDDRKRPGPDRRSTEISKVVAEAFENVILTGEFPRASVDVNMEILEAEAGTRCAALTAGAVALADAGIPMRSMVSSCAAGKIDDTVVLDLGKEEDNFGQADLPVAYNHGTGEVVLLQMDGHLTRKEFDEALEMAIHGCQSVYDIQKAALAKRYSVTLDGANGKGGA